MAGKSFWSSQWFFGTMFSLVFVICAWGLFADTAQTLERQLYDFGVRLDQREAHPDVAVIAIDDQSIENFGRWPWPRELHAQLIDKLTRSGARVIGNTILYSEQQVDPGQSWISGIYKNFKAAGLGEKVAAGLPELDKQVAALKRSGARSGRRTVQAYEEAGLSADLAKVLLRIDEQLKRADRELQTDRRLAVSYFQAKNVVQAYTLKLGYPRGRPDSELPKSIAATIVPAPADAVLLPSLGITPPIDIIADRAASLGHLTTLLDVDGAQRSEPLLIKYFDTALPSLSLMLAAKALNLKPSDIRLEADGVLSLADLKIGTTGDGRMLTHYYSGSPDKPAFSVDSFFDVAVDNIPPEKYQGKIVLIGASATGVGDRFATPVSGAMPPAEVLAHTVSSLLREDFYEKPAWTGAVVAVLVLLIAVWVALGLPALKPVVGLAISLLTFVLLILATPLLLASVGLWIPLGVPAAMVALGYLAVTAKNLGVTERLRASSEMESAESNRMLGIAFQSQGQLDMAFDKLRKCPAEDATMDALVNLAADYERKRQFSKAITVYEHAGRLMPEWPDLDARLARAKKLNDTVMLGGTVGAATLMLSGDGIDKPTLGRYEIERELGKGAMGTVYLGKDPKIGRTVAIKTMALAQEFEADELEEVKERFFREAETAGRLTHPNIVAIYDAGDEHDLAYIAMELIDGTDLEDYIKPDKLLPIADVIHIMCDAANALEFAHHQNVVHRDIKPANLMYIPDKKLVKLTDFGIARLTDSSKTKTGMILGTPSYMSPEQVAGKKIDGRSDLFSLGVTLYQMLTGALPFKGDSMASLMFQIASQDCAPPSMRRNDLPAGIDDVMRKMLAKNPDDRYQSGSEFSAALKPLAG